MRGRKLMAPVLLATIVGGGLHSAVADSSTTSTDVSGLPPEKAQSLALEQQWQERLEADAADPSKKAAIIAAKKAEAARMAAEPAEPIAPKWPEGIFADSEAPAPGTVFLCTNRWVGTVAGRSVAVYAGRAGDNLATGRLMVVTAAPDMSIDSSDFVDLPGSGALRITSADGMTLTIVDAHGAKHAFDVSSLNWS